jgi:hypothetical protein
MARPRGWWSLPFLALGLGCSLAPRNFRNLTQTAPIRRARAVSLGERLPDSQAVPALIGHLDDTDPVVRLSAHEELKRRSGKDFGYVPWADRPERAGAITRWRAWWGARQAALFKMWKKP